MASITAAILTCSDSVKPTWCAQHQVNNTMLVWPLYNVMSSLNMRSLLDALSPVKVVNTKLAIRAYPAILWQSIQPADPANAAIKQLAVHRCMVMGAMNISRSPDGTGQVSTPKTSHPGGGYACAMATVRNSNYNM